MCGRRMSDDVTLKPMMPFYKLMFADGTEMDCSGDAEAMKAEISKFAPDELAAYENFLVECEAIYKVGFEQLGHVPFTTIMDMVKAIPSMAMRRLQCGSPPARKPGGYYLTTCDRFETIS